MPVKKDLHVHSGSRSLPGKMSGMNLVASPRVFARSERPVVTPAAQPGWISAHRDLLVLAAILAGAAYLRFHLLANKSFWFDEGFSVGVARLDWLNFHHLWSLREANKAL